MAIYTYDLATDVGMMRLLIADTAVSGDATTCDFSDEELTALQAFEGGSVRCGAARALETLAANRARLAVHVQRGGVSENLVQVGVQLLASAKELRAQAEAEDETGGVLSQFVSPSWDRFSYNRNLLLGRETGDAL